MPQSALRRNLFRKATPTQGQVAAIAAYVREAARLDGEPIDLSSPVACTSVLRRIAARRIRR